MESDNDRHLALQLFVRNTLGCGCPDEVVARIGYQEGIASPSCTYNRMDVGGRLLVLVVGDPPAGAIKELIQELLELGLAEEFIWADQRFRELTGSDAPWRQEVRRGFREGQSMEDRLRAWLSVALAHRDEVHPIAFAYFYAYLGENDLAFEWLEQLYERRDSNLVLLQVHPLWDPIRSDPRFDDLLRRINHPGAS